jgi:peptide/nickel transport system substrate-binding protein
MHKTAASLAVGILSVLLLAACGGGGSSKKASLSGSGGTSKSAACQGSPVRGGNLVYERQAATETLNPLAIINGNGDIFSYNLIYSGLVRSDPNGGSRLEPSLAQRWKVSPDGKTYTFTLRPNLKFSNGQPVTAEDVAWSLNNFGDPKINAAMSSVSGGYGSAKVINPTTVEVKLKAPVAAFLYNISIWPAFILPKNLVEKQGAAFYKHPVGTGPFMVKEYVKGSHITFVPNPYYWEKGKPYLNSVRYNFATDSNSRILALRSGAAQIMDGLPFSQIASIQANKNLRVQSAKVPLFMGLWLNHKKTGFSDLNVRRAIQYALNRKQMNQAIFHGLGKIPNSVLMGFDMDASPSTVKPYPYDVAKAKELMAASKYPKGFSTTLQYPSGYDFYTQMALLLQQELGAIGIKLKLQETDPATGTANFLARKYDMTFPFASFTSDVTVPDEYADFLGDPDNGLNGFFSNWKDPAIQKEIKTFVTTLSNSERVKQWAKIQGDLLSQTPVVNVMNLPFVNAHSARTCGTAIDALGSDHLEDTWFAGGSAGAAATTATTETTTTG